MELTKRRSKIRSQLWKLLPKPLPDSWVLDFLYIAELMILQDFVIPQIFAGEFFLDLITPWILIVFVLRSPLRMFTLGLFTAFLMETHSALPRGLFLCLYWVLGVTLYYVRHHISWASFLPWSVLFFISQIFIVVFEGISYWTQNYSSFSLLTSIFGVNFLSGLLSCFLGVFIIYKFRLDTLEEHRLARR